MDHAINECVCIAVEKQAAKLVNDYILFWKTDISMYDVKYLDTKYFYLVNAHNMDYIDIFHYSNCFFHNLFFV